MNVINLVGRAGSDPDIKIFESGTNLTKVSIAVKRKSKNSEPDWFPVQFWGKLAQIAGDYVKQGSLIGVTGTLKIDRWTDKEGVERIRPYVHADELELLGSKSNEVNKARFNSDGVVSGFKIPDSF